MLVEERGIRILIDPGTFSTQQNELKNVDFVLITHEHTDHFHIDSLKLILENNPNIKIVTNGSVGKLLSNEKINYHVVENGQSFDADGVLVEAFGEKHALMHKTLIPVQNTGFFIANKLFFPGDAFTNPNKYVEILALPVAGPWMKLSEAIDYAIEISPKICFPVHDGILKSPGVSHLIPKKILEEEGINFLVLELDQEKVF
jgi:L-ascorbate metabolism protein UlaG (beta-lactamase superfamily)